MVLTAILAGIAALAPALQPVINQLAPTPSAVPGYIYTDPFFPGATYNPDIKTPDQLLGFPVCSKPATHAHIEACMKAWADTPRSKLFEYAKSHEGKTLYYLVISSEENIKNLATIKADIASLADPRTLSASQSDDLAAKLPAVAWMAYVIHGDEMSGSDASLVLAHHLIASKDLPDLLKKIIVIIDPLMNPDGRDRYIAQLSHDRTAQPSLDDQSVLHSRPWPAGRTNHYLFDMNRDWILGIQPESRGRIKSIGEWHPQLLMESHEMGSQDTFLFSPPREPVNPNLAPSMRHWWDIFSKDLATSFDAHGWKYYHGEWNEEWYPGYSSAWAGYRGAIDILFEQASIATDAVRKGSGVLETYRESTHHQLVGSLANLTTLAANRDGILKDFLAQRRDAVAATGPFADRTFAIVPNANRSRTAAFVDLMKLQGFEVFTSTGELKSSGKDQLGRVVTNKTLPAGTILIPNRQPEARLLAAILEFDTRMTRDFLEEERRELLRFGRSQLYDVTAWNITMLHGLEAYELAAALPADAKPYEPPSPTPQALPAKPTVDKPTAWVIDGEDDLSVAAAARIMERGVRCRVSDKPFTFDNHPFARGSVVVSIADNRLFAGADGGGAGDLGATIKHATNELGLSVIAVASGLGPGDAPDIGGEHFILLDQPRIAVLARDPFDVYSFGEIWHLFDHTMGIRASYVDLSTVKSGADLRRYNVLVVPEGGGNDVLKDQLDAIKAWVKGGGTLIAIGDSAAYFATESAGIAAARTFPDVMNKLDDYSMTIAREWQGRNSKVDESAIWAYTLPPCLLYTSPSPRD